MTKVQPFLEFDSKDFRIIYRPYEARDSEEAIALEEEASQHYTLFGMVAVGTIFGGDYDSKCRRFADHIILLAEAIDKENPEVKKICGCACLGIKDMYFNGKLVKTGVLFDLRVSQQFQKRGIGGKLTSLLEETARKKGCEFFYLSVNGTNKKAIALYNKNGYETISERTIHSQMIPKQPIEDRNNTNIVRVKGDLRKLYFHKLSADQAREHYQAFYKSQDLALADFDELLFSREYIGTYAVTCDDNPRNMVGLSLFKIDCTNAMGLKRLFAPAHYFTKEWFTSILLALLLLILYPIILGVYNGLAKTSLPGAARHIIGLLIFFVIAWGCVFLYKKFNSLMVLFSKLSPSGRFIGPFYQLENPELMEEMFKFLTQRAKKSASDHHITTILMNADKNDKLLPLIAGSKLTVKWKTYFMGKSITKKEDGQSVTLQNRKKSEFMFFDPRDF